MAGEAVHILLFFPFSSGLRCPGWHSKCVFKKWAAVFYACRNQYINPKVSLLTEFQIQVDVLLGSFHGYVLAVALWQRILIHIISNKTYSLWIFFSVPAGISQLFIHEFWHIIVCRYTYKPCKWLHCTYIHHVSILSLGSRQDKRKNRLYYGKCNTVYIWLNI